MNTLEIIDSDVDRWIEEEDLSPHGSWKVVSRFAGLYPEDPEENEAYWDFIHWAMVGHSLQNFAKQGDCSCPIDNR